MKKYLLLSLIASSFLLQTLKPNQFYKSPQTSLGSSLKTLEKYCSSFPVVLALYLSIQGVSLKKEFNNNPDMSASQNLKNYFTNNPYFRYSTLALVLGVLYKYYRTRPREFLADKVTYVLANAFK